MKFANKNLFVELFKIDVFTQCVYFRVIIRSLIEGLCCQRAASGCLRSLSVQKAFIRWKLQFCRSVEETFFFGLPLTEHVYETRQLSLLNRQKMVALIISTIWKVRRMYICVHL